MPTYEYECQKCGHRFDVFQSMSDDRLSKCPVEKCSGKLRRLIGAGAGLIFKGQGFYQTDYRSESYKKGAEKDVAPAPTSDSSKSDSGKKKKEGASGKKAKDGTKKT
jgi:putative FmdB family regulatory protein